MEPVILHVCAFDPIVEGAEGPPHTVIFVDRGLPRHKTLQECADFHEQEAQAIVKALGGSLPQGTFDRLGIEFMRHKVSLYRGKTTTP